METNVTKIIVKIPSCDNFAPPINNMPIPIAKMTTIAPISGSKNNNKLIKDVITIGFKKPRHELSSCSFLLKQ